jgi:hypothetical protein
MLPKLPKRHFPKPDAQQEEPVDWRISSRAYVQRYYCDLSGKALLFNFLLGVAAWQFFPWLLSADVLKLIAVMSAAAIPITYVCIKLVPVDEDLRDAHGAKKFLRALEIGLSIALWFLVHFYYAVLPVFIVFVFFNNR